MSVHIKEYKGYEAEWHPAKDLVSSQKLDGDHAVFCPVCGEIVAQTDYAGGRTVTCPDCGVYSEIVCVPGDKAYIVVYETEVNEGTCTAFYERHGI